MYSASDTAREERVTLGKNDLLRESIVVFVTCLNDGNWWLVCVLEIIHEESLVKLRFLHPHEPSNSFKFPELQDIRTVQIDAILTLVDPRAKRNNIYTLSKQGVATTCTSEHFFLSTIIN